MLRYFFVSLVLLMNFGCGGRFLSNSDSPGTISKIWSVVKNESRHAQAQETLAAGTVIRASLDLSLSTEKNVAGDPFTMKVIDSPDVNDKTVIPVGSTIKGVVAESVCSGRVKGRAEMSLRFTELVLPSGRTYAIQSAGVSRIASRTNNPEAVVIERRAGLGSLAGGIGGNGAGVGAASGAGGGTGAISGTSRKATGFSQGSTLNVKLTEPLKVNLS